MTTNEKRDNIIQIIDDMKAERIAVLDVHQKTSVADYFIVCSGNSDVHINAIASKLEDKLRDLKVKPLRTESKGGGWVLIDYGDIILHVMKEEQRQFYDLETLWESIHQNPDLEP